VLAQIAGLESIDAVLISGDLADHGRAAEYEQFFAELPRSTPSLLTPGNHDLAEPLLARLSTAGRSPSLDNLLDLADVRLIGLDSHIDHVDGGELAKETIADADHQISTAEGRVILAMHHTGHRCTECVEAVFKARSIT